jgi:hypothetical protein
MRIILFLIFSFSIAFTNVKAQNRVPKKSLDTTLTKKTDTGGYINKGKVAGRKAIRRSLFFPGLGQMYNYGLVVNDVKSGFYSDKRVLQKIYIIGKIGLIYGGGTLLVTSYIDNNAKYKQFLSELQYRQLNGNQPKPGNGLERYTNTDALITAKAIYKNNREVVLISIGALYGMNVLDAYVTARLKYHNVENELAYKISPTLINSSTIYGYSAVPGLKLTLKL